MVLIYSSFTKNTFSSAQVVYKPSEQAIVDSERSNDRKFSFLSSETKPDYRPLAERGLEMIYLARGPKGLRAESARAVTGRQCPHSGEGEGQTF